VSAPADLNLTGVWTGLYSYAHGLSVTFTATLLHSGPHLSGQVHEPDTFAGAGGLLHAAIDGRVEDRRVAFTKTYLDLPPEFSGNVRYVGAVSADGLEIDGTWRLPGHSGRFLMTRNGGVAVAERRRETVKA